jgi:hypothetical protein
MEDAAVGNGSISVAFGTRVAEQIPFRGATREITRCVLPSTDTVTGFGHGGDLILLQRSDGVEVWSLKTCRAIGSVSATAQDWGMSELVSLLLSGADEIRGDHGKLFARVGKTEAVIESDSGILVVSRGAVRLHLPSSSIKGVQIVPVAVSPDLRRVAVVQEDRNSGVNGLSVFSLDNGLSMSWPITPPVLGKRWSTSESTHSVWGVAFSAGGEQLTILEPDQIMAAYIGPAQAAFTNWMKDVDVGVTGLRTGEDGNVYSPADAAHLMQDFRRRLEIASRAGDRAAQALLLVLNKDSTTR